jgi:hypothetical protein
MKNGSLEILDEEWKPLLRLVVEFFDFLAVVPLVI